MVGMISCLNMGFIFAGDAIRRFIILEINSTLAVAGLALIKRFLVESIISPTLMVSGWRLYVLPVMHIWGMYLQGRDLLLRTPDIV